MDSDEVEQEVKRYLSLFDEIVFKETLEQLMTLLELWKRVHSRIHKDEESTLHVVGTFNAIKAATMREEFLAHYDLPGSAAIFDSVDNLFSRLTSTNKSLEWGMAFREIMTRTEMFENMRATRRKLMELSKAMQITSSGEVRYYLGCFMFLLAMEGMYDEVVRCIYAHEQIIQGKTVITNELWHKRIEIIKKSIRTAPEAIFSVWDRGHRVRNAIAHANFHYSDDDKKMRFVDVNPYNPADIYTTSMAIDELQELHKRVVVIEIAFRNLFLLLMIYTALMSRAGKVLE